MSQREVEPAISEPTQEARVSVEKTARRMGADLVVPANPSMSLLKLITYVMVVIGAAAGPSATLSALPASFPTSAATAIVVGQLVVMAIVTLVATASNHRPKRT